MIPREWNSTENGVLDLAKCLSTYSGQMQHGSFIIFMSSSRNRMTKRKNTEGRLYHISEEPLNF